ncbi:hypothetical protein QBC35DRAFT_86281 [Podospora australis]|uniref:Uncharacterized protein n=1 Tax=Podospora australis TaxID=1536484 RepID=A0AAN6X2F3_9PEZI|nr:hypothetical protein QBC35DRAFT_86281 [Podospora australis]
MTSQKTISPHVLAQDDPVIPILVKFDAYPWAQDKEFMQGLHAALGDSLGNLSDPFTKRKVLDMIIHSRIWWYASRFGVQLSFETYISWTASTNSQSCPDEAILKKSEWIYTNLKKKNSSASAEDGKEKETDVEIPEWQRSAPKVDLSKKAEPDHDASSSATVSRADGSYPDKFQALVAAVTAGTPVPGIREIPNTVVRQEGITPIGTRGRAPLKPWERHRAPVPEDSQLDASVLDKQFPPLA